ncbi:MAG: 2'-deoxycytidine 5'-triphosphate deaminase domain-containing protein, partial [Nitrospinota bacterium]
MKKGVLSDFNLRKMVEARNIVADAEIPDTQIQPSSLDLRLGNKGYRIRASFLPQGALVSDVLKNLEMYDFDLSENPTGFRNKPA